MDLTFTPLQEELRTEARAFLAGTPSPTWAELAALGWTGCSVAESLGGAGLSFLEEGVLFEETGRALLHSPFLSTVAGILPALPPAEQTRVASGEASWALALGPLVPDLDTVTHLAIVGGDEIRELVGAERDLLETVDATRPLGIVTGGEPGARLASSDVLPALRARLLAALALEACGVASAALELAVAHAREREQFGRPIGAYQAVAFPLADAYASVELARSLAWWAAWCVATAHPDAPLAAASAKAAAADAAVAACGQAIQTLGGIGFTWEHPLHRYYKRSLGIRSWEASPAQLRGEVADHLIEGGR
ncbi:MAG: acyl-CoA dehydrogenase [Thermoleophilia bacterium]|nr:acyl-CoA dehydrogenase [Thermoleophilia bacterium]